MAAPPWLMIWFRPMFTWTGGTSSRLTVASALTAFRCRALARSWRSCWNEPSANE